MPFTPESHRTIAWGNLFYLAVFVVALYNVSLQPVTIVHSQLESLQTLTFEEKMAWISNATAQPQPDSALVPLQLHFTNRPVDLGPCIVLVGLFITLYSLLSVAWMHGANGCESFGSVPFSLGTVGSDATSMMMDMIFWMLFALFHGVAYLWLVRFCLQESVAWYVLVSAGTTWMLANRVVTCYIPAVVSCGFFFCVVHASAVLAVMEIETNQWLTYFILFMIDGVLLVGHMFDEAMVLEVVMNCRIVYACAVGMYMSMLLFFI